MLLECNALDAYGRKINADISTGVGLGHMKNALVGVEYIAIIKHP